MAEVIVHGEPDYERFKRGVRMMFADLSPEMQLKYASKVSGTGRNNDQEPIESEKRP
ncbi:MAG: hypothetical protein ACI36W_06600 [Coriobacteriales bacterium]